MIKDILYKSDILDGLFTQRDFEFLKDSNDRQEELEYEIKKIDLKRDKIIECINKIDIDSDEMKNVDSKKLKKYVDAAESAFESVNCIIRNLTKLLDEFTSIEKDILELVVKQEANSNINTIAKVGEINNKISAYKIEQEQIEIQNRRYNTIVDNFLNEAQLDKIIKKETKSSRNKKELNRMSTTYNKNDIDLKDNLELIVSEKQRRVYLPYTKAEIESFLNNYPEEYHSAKDVIEQEFITDISIYNKHPILARFREAYSLSRNKEMKSAIDSLKFAMDMMFRSDINPTIIAAVKSQKQLEAYIECLETNQLEKFKYFTIRFEVNPI